MANGIKPEMIQICVVVRDLDESIQRYTSVFGIEKFHVYTVDTADVADVTVNGQPSSYAVRVGMAKLGNVVLELFQSLHGQTIWKDYYDRHGEGIHHIGLIVGDYAAALEEFTRKGFKVTVDGPILGKPRDGRFTYLDTQKELGATFELLDFPEDFMANWR